MNLTPSHVTGDWTNNQYPCFLDPATHWNGWACPYFTKEVAEQVLSDTNSKWQYDAHLDGFLVDDVETRDVDTYAGVPTEHGTLYPVGSMWWCWQEVKS